MLRTKGKVFTIRNVPEEWIFEFYLNLPEKLEGQDVNIKSAFNPGDTNPSMFIFYSGNRYFFKDFSSGNKGGDAIQLVIDLFDEITSRNQASNKIKADYKLWLKSNEKDKRVFIQRTRYKIKDYTIGDWYKHDADYWLSYRIGHKTLKKFNVKPIKNYKMSKIENGKETILEIDKRFFIYGYFKNDGTLYKIYQPKLEKGKFIKVEDYIQGIEQLTYKKKYLVICSSLKDIMGFETLWYKDVENVAPDSENTLIPKNIIAALMYKYEKICTLFDNDAAGRQAALLYEKEYGIPGVNLDMSKDLSDSIRDYPKIEVMEKLTPLLRKALK